MKAQGEEARDFCGGRVRVLVGDLTRQSADAIVNAANSTLLGGGGVDGAIHRAGGGEILRACEEIRRTLYPQGLPTGEAVITTSGNLPARYVIHTVGPIYGQHHGDEAKLLADCYRNSLALAAARQLASIAFPAISTGVYGYPRTLAAAVSSQAIKEFLAGEEAHAIKQVRLVFFNPFDAEDFLKHHKFD
ncbi:MAG: O-acetyl-ADP-ribose deacetylase [Pyrinomonadaceae bacterium]